VVQKPVTTSLSRARCYISLLDKVSASIVYVRSPLPFFERDLALRYELIIAAAAVFPLLAAKQRKTHQNDWMSSDGLVACPDPNCKSVLKITRTGLRTFSHAETTVVGLEGNV